MGKRVSVRARELFRAYQEWCEENNERACSERFLSLRLKELGLERSRTAEARYWRGYAQGSTLLIFVLLPPAPSFGLP
jgi:putative DNA primase/helicase